MVAIQSPVVGRDTKANGSTEGRDPARNNPPDMNIARVGRSPLRGDDTKFQGAHNLEQSFIVFSEMNHHLIAKRTLQANVLQQVAQLMQFVFAKIANMLLLEGEFALEHLFLGLRGYVLSRRHGDRPGDGSGYSREQDVASGHPAADDPGHEEKHRHQPIVDTQNDVSQVLTVAAQVLGIGRAFLVGRVRAHKPEV